MNKLLFSNYYMKADFNSVNHQYLVGIYLTFPPFILLSEISIKM